MPPRLVAGDARSATQSAPVLRLLPAACSGNPRCPGPGRQCPADPSREAPARPRAPPPGACRSAQSRAGPGRHWHTLLSAPVFVFLRAVRRAPRCPGPSQRWPARESILPRPTPPSPGPLPCRPPSRATSAGTRALCGRPFWGRICIQRWQHPPARPAMGDPVSATGPPAGYAAPQPSLEVTAQRSRSPRRGRGGAAGRMPLPHRPRGWLSLGPRLIAPAPEQVPPPRTSGRQADRSSGHARDAPGPPGLEAPAPPATSPRWAPEGLLRSYAAAFLDSPESSRASSPPPAPPAPAASFRLRRSPTRLGPHGLTLQLPAPRSARCSAPVEGSPLVRSSASSQTRF